MSTQPITPPDLVDRIIDRLERCGPAANKNDKAKIAIRMCIAAGVDTMHHIVSTLMIVGFNRGHAGAILTGNTGVSPSVHLWSLGPNGRYRLHER